MPLRERDITTQDREIQPGQEPDRRIKFSADEEVIPADRQISLFPDNNAFTKNERAARVQAEKTDYALGDLSPGEKTVFTEFLLGHEARMRQEQAIRASTEERQRQNDLAAMVVHQAVTDGRELTDRDRAFILDTVQEDRSVSPDIVLEKLYARKMTEDTLTKKRQDQDVDLYEEAATEAPTVADEIRRLQEDTLLVQQIALTEMERIRNLYDDTSWLRWGVDLVKGMLPFYTWSNLTDRLDGIKTSSVLTGRNIQEQIRGLYLLPPEEFKRRLEEALDEIAETNIVDAIHFAQAVVAYSTSDQLWDSMFFGLDVVDVTTLGTFATAKALTAASRQASRARSVVSSNSFPQINKTDIRVISGDMKGAAEEAVFDRLIQKGMIRDAANVNQIPGQRADVMTETAFSVFDVNSHLRSARSLTAERQRRLMDSLAENDRVLTDILAARSGRGFVQRTNDEAFRKGAEIADRRFRHEYRNLEDAIIDVRPRRESAEAFGGVDRVEFLLGHKDATGFNTPRRASFFAERMYRLPKGSYDIVEEHGNYFIRMSKTIDETDPSLAALRLSPENITREEMSRKPYTWLHTLFRLGTVRTPDELLGREHVAWRKVATYGGSGTLARLSETANVFQRLSKGEWDRFTEVLNAGRFEKRPVVDTDGQVKQVSGKFYNQNELEQVFMKRFNQMPTENESLAYAQFRQLMEFDYHFRNISIYRDKARQGIEEKQIGAVLENRRGGSNFQFTPFFEGRTVDNLPSFGDTPFTVAWVSPESGRLKSAVSNRMFRQQRDELEELLESGKAQIIQVDPTEGRNRFLNDVTGAGGAPVNFVVAPSVKSRPLSFNQLPRNEGGHWVYPQVGTYLKQARTHKDKFGRRVYDSDTTAMYFFSRKQGEQFAKDFETARQMLLRAARGDGTFDETAFQRFVETRLPVRSTDEFKKMFRSPDNPDGAFDLETPFVLTNHGQRAGDARRLSDVFGEEVVDAGRSPYSLSNRINSQYAQERGERLMTVDQAGTEANPVFAQTPAPLMDSMEALTRSMAGIARSRFFDDLKHRSVEDWVAQFADTLNAPIGEVRADPWRFIRDAPQFWKKDYHDAPKMAAARDARRNILALMNEDTVDMTIAKWAHHKVIDSLFQARGIQGMKILHPTLWDSRTDPVTIARSAVFHMKLGLLNVLQFPLQGMAVITAAAMDGSPLRAAQANFAYWGMRMRGLAEANPKAQGLITRKISEALGVDRKTLDEMFQVWRDSGMHRIEGEYAKRDDVFNPRMFLDRNTATRGLDAGTFFFKEGNNWHRGVSFATAFLRWRKDNPTKAITNEDMMRIVGRADDMYLNMSKASNNPNIQRGLMSVPTQFFAYHLRVMELMTGHRLTPMEKARMMGVYSLIWGLPVGVGGTMVGAVWPAHDAIRQYALEHGMDVDANPIIQFMMDGTVSMMTSYFTEMDFDVGNRFGPGGMTWLRDLIDGNLLDALGAAPNMINTVLETASPFARMFGAAFSEDGFEVTTDDIISAFREISTVNNVYRAYWMYNAGEWRTRQEAAVHNVPGAEGNLPAAIAVALGLTPKDVADHYILMRSNKQFDDAKRAAEQEALIHLRRSVRAAQDGEFERSEQALKNFYIILNSAGFTPMERAAVARRFYRDHSDQVDEAERQFMRRDPARRQELILRRQQERMERRLD